MIHGRKEDEESEQSYTEEERKGSAILQDEDPKVIEDSD